MIVGESMPCTCVTAVLGSRTCSIPELVDVCCSRGLSQPDGSREGELAPVQHHYPPPPFLRGRERVPRSAQSTAESVLMCVWFMWGGWRQVRHGGVVDHVDDAVP